MRYEELDRTGTSGDTNRKTGKRKRARLVRLISIAGGTLSILAAMWVTSARGDDAATPSTATVHRNQPAAPANPLIADGVDDQGRLKLTVNKTAVLTTRAPYKRVSVGQPDVADVNTIGPGNILVTARKAGTTQLIVWDDADRSQVIDVCVGFDLNAMQDQLKAMFPDSKIEVTTLNGAIALRGRVPNLDVADQVVAVASPYSEKVLNFLEVSGGQQVMLQVRFAEVSRSAATQLGVNFAVGDGITTFASNIGAPNAFEPATPLGNIERSLPASATLFGSGRVGSTAFEYFINALRQNNLMRTLAEPNLVTMSGQEASFLAGGEFPVPVTQGGGTGGVAVTIEYREFGVKLRFVPVVLGNGRIRLKAAPEVSDLDFTNAVRLNGFLIPGLTSRKVETSVELAEGQTLALAGLLNNTVTSSKEVTPLLGDLPIIGALFRSVRYQRKETELVVLVTPRIVSAMNPDQVPLLPGEKWRTPSENDLFWNRDIGGEEDADREGATTRPAPADRSPPRFRGPYGFVPSTQPVSSAD